MRNSTFLKSFLLLCALIVGSSSAWADYEEVYTFTIKKNSSYSAYASTYDVTINDMDWNVPGNHYADGQLRIGGKNFDDTDRTITGKSPFSEAISKITFNHGGISSDKITINSVKLTVASDAEYSSVIDEVTLTPTIAKNTDGSFDFVPTSPLEGWATGSYYKIAINCKCTDTSSNRFLLVKSIVFYKNVDKTATTTAIDATGITNTNVATSTEAGSLSASVRAGGSPVAGATVTWSSSEEGVATITDAGVVTLVAAGTTTITASYAGDETYSASSDTYELTVTDPRVPAGLAYEEASLTVTVGDVLSAPTLTNPNGLAVTYSSADEAIATVDESGNVTGVAVGSTTITASFAGNASYSAGSASYTITVQKAKPVGALFYESVSGYTGSSDVSTELLTTYANLDSDNWDSFSKVYAGKVLSGDTDGNLKFGSGSYAGTAVTKAIALTGTGKLTYKVQRYDSNNAGNLKITVTGATATGDVDVTGTAAWVEKTVYLANAEGNVVITFATTDADKRIRVDDILVTQITSVSATVTSAGWATWIAPLTVEVPSTVKAYYVKVNGNKTSLTEKSVIPAGIPVLLQGEGVHEFTVTDVVPNEAIDNDLLISGAGEEPQNPYVLAKPAGKSVGFYKWTDTAALPTGKVYIECTPSNAPDFISLGDDATGIEDVVKSEEIRDKSYYNLSGQRVAQPTKGFYIVNGKKVIIK